MFDLKFWGILGNRNKWFKEKVDDRKKIIDNLVIGVIKYGF